jgi:hypothetical protein
MNMDINYKLKYNVDCFKERYNQWDDIEDPFEKAIKKALGDFTFRTTKKQEHIDVKGVEGLYKQICSDPNNSLINRFKDYGVDNYSEKDVFDEWHKTTCDALMNVLKNLYQSIHYGKAQKIVNMTFKYLYCISNDRNDNYYKYCHIPLDSIILDWIWANKSVFQDAYDKFNMDVPFQHQYFENWSNLDYSNNKFDGNRYSYMFFQELIRAFCEGKKITPLQLEFLVWPQFQWEKAAKEFCKQTENMLNINSNMDEKSANKLLNSIYELLENKLILIDWKNDL